MANGGSGSSRSRGLHALVMPHPLQGHITPLLHLSQKLARSYHVAITFVVSEHILSQMKRHDDDDDDNLPSNMELVGLPDNLPCDHPRHSSFKDSYDVVSGMEASVDMFLQELSSKAQIPSFIIADTFATWMHSLCVKYGVPRVAFATTNATALAVMSSTPELVDLGILPLRTIDGSSKYVDQDIVCISGLMTLQPQELPYSMRSPSLSHYRLQFLLAQAAVLSKAAAVVVNSVTELEKDIIDNFECKAPLLCIGPSLLLNHNDLLSQHSMGRSLWPEQDDCLPWLDRQRMGSVLYIAFGSITNLDKAQLVELAHGLEASEQPFLWVIRPGSVEGSLPDILPAGFLERVKDRGYIVPWCPQLQVLGHAAVGGFMTHCGWNSILENLSLRGVPMVCWPDAAEQALNAKVIVDMWNVGLRVKKENDETVKRGEVERVVRAVMCEDGAKDLKRRASDIGNIAKRAVQEEGSSVKSIEKVLEIVSHYSTSMKASID